MKKILSLALAAAMAVSVLPVAYAAENETDYTNGTQISYMGTQEVENGGAGDVYTVTVPAKMVPGDTGTVKAEGMWAADKILSVGIPNSVTLTYGAQSMDVGITCHKDMGSLEICGFSQIGSSTEEISVSYDITVAEASTLFGTWEGILEYDVTLIQKGDVNQDGIIALDDADLLKNYFLNPSENPISEAGMLVGDVNGDGDVDAADSTHLKAVVNLNVWTGKAPAYTPNATTE